MPRSRLRLFVAIVVAALGTACSNAPDQPLVPSSEAYRTWERSTDVVLNEPIPGHGYGLRRIFINETGTTVRPVGDGDVSYPDGTIVVKEVFGSPEPAPGAEPVMLTVMVKRPDDERSIGGWVWIMKEFPDGEEQILDVEFCLTCHSNANEAHPYGDGNPDLAFRDYLFY